MAELENYKAATEALVEPDFINKSGILGADINILFADAEGFQINAEVTNEFNYWWNYFECGTWKDLIDLIWAKIKELWDKYFG